MQFESTLFVVMCWKRAPFLRIVTPLLAGITLQLYVSALPVLLWELICMAAGGLLLFRFLPVQWRFAAAWIPGILLSVLLGCCGSLLLYNADTRHQKGFYADAITDTSLLFLRINEPPEEKPRTFKTTAEVIAVKERGAWLPVKGCLMLYLAKDSASPSLQYGDELVARKKPQFIKNSGNPGAFDYQQYCAARQIYQQLYLRPPDYRKLPRQGDDGAHRLLLRARDYCLTNLKKYIGSGPEAGMAEALLIGYRLDLDKDVVQHYSNTGIVHIIAISGMHLALLYGTLLWLLKWLPARKWTHFGKAAVILLVLWGFTLLTGASASVLRSAVMFTGITIGRFVLARYSSIYNTLAASAFVLLCCNPYLAIDVGFQLSYLAVLSILLFYQPVYRLIKPQKKWMDAGWQMMALSISAQLLTTPVCLFYFHQFPNYFLLANLIAVPLSTIIIYGEVVLLFLAPFHVPATWAGCGLKYLIMLMNNCVKWLGELPFALVTNIHCSLFQTIFLYLVIAGMALWLMVKWKPGLWVALFSLWGCMLLHVYWIAMRSTQRKMIVYNVHDYTAIDCVEGNRVQFAGDDTLWQLPAAQPLLAARSSMGVHAARSLTFRQHGHYLTFHGQRLLIIDSSMPQRAPPEKFRTDYILLTHNPRVNIRQLDSFYAYHTLIFAASNSAGRIARWKKDCKVLTRECYVISEQGAFIRSFE